MQLSQNFEYDFGSVINGPMQTELTSLYNKLNDQLVNSKIYYENLKISVKDILLDESNPPSVDQVDILNADLATLLVGLKEGTLNFGQLGGTAFGMAQTGFEFDPYTGYLTSLPPESINVLIDWVRNSIKTATNDQYYTSIYNLHMLMTSIVKYEIEKLLIIIDSITSNNGTPSITSQDVADLLETVGLSFSDDPDISLLDDSITDKFVQKHLVTTKLYTALEKQIIFTGGYEPDIYLACQNLLTPPF